MPDQKKHIEKLINDPSFRRWVMGGATEKERAEWDRWVMENPRNRSAAMKAQEEVGGFSIKPAEAPDSVAAWRRLQEKARGTQKHTIYSVSGNRGGRSGSILWLARIAAVLLLAGLTTVLVSQMSQEPVFEVAEKRINKVSTKTGEQKVLTFHDGSEVILNGNSSVTYTVDRNDLSAVNIHLEGEAYFSVKSREGSGQSPFLIETEQGSVSVLGTKFMVSTGVNQTRVVLEKGSVSIQTLYLRTETIMEPGQLGEFSSQSESISIRQVNPDIYTSWVYGRLIFEKTAMREVIKRIEDTFGVQVVIRNSDLYDQRISGSIESSDLETITSAFSKMLNVSISRSETDGVIYVGE